MLLRMYLRWAERHRFKTEIEESSALLEEARASVERLAASITPTLKKNYACRCGSARSCLAGPARSRMRAISSSTARSM